ncbi:hypothetical protein DUZ99_11785 [Xylanibacillus composti]|uniref:Uncharacterized protein n=1 Tax=Xylanibacillus composti TaxID=1572762 RepID=A0A8J4H2Y7_9BACL|nr:hypothetical protein [Xylanibacillus composti]GIQ67748.1 hypothetical protein XYCOK13_05720 [Xylanibacillus composti]
MLEAARRGMRIVLLVATAGEASKSVKRLGVTPQEMASMRKKEMQECADLLGIGLASEGGCIVEASYPAPIH